MKDLRLDLFLKLGALFGMIQALTMVISRRLAVKGIERNVSSISYGDTLFFLLYVLAATVLFLVFAKTVRTRNLLKVFWFIALFSGFELFLANFIRSDFALLITLASALLYWKAPTIYFHNLLLVCALPAIASVLGAQIAPWSAVLLLSVFSIYDVIAVYGTGHMVNLAKAFIAEHVIPGIIIAERPIDPTLFVKEITIGAGFSVLGTGDLVFPAMLTSSVAIGNLSQGVFVAAFSVLGLLLTHLLFFVQRERRPMPALPPIAGFAILGFLASLVYVR